jgi:hypothetical protein
MTKGAQMYYDEEVFHWLKVDTRKLIAEIRRLKELAKND